MQEERDQIWLKPNADVGDIHQPGDTLLLWMDTGTQKSTWESNVVTPQTKN